MDQFIAKGKEINVTDTERVLSLATGAWLVFRMLRKRNIGLVNGAAAAFLLYRGLSGHCPGRKAVEDYKAKIQEEANYPIDSPVEDTAVVNKIVTP